MTAATITRFDACLPWILSREGGFVNNQADRGGATNMGITRGTLAAWRHASVSVEDVRTLTEDEAADIYRTNYWAVAGCDACPPGVDLSVFDAAVMSGPGRAVKFLQAAANVAPDGAFGPLTARAVKAAYPVPLVVRIAWNRGAFYRAIVEKDATQTVFLKGWLTRVEATKDEAMSAVREAA